MPQKQQQQPKQPQKQTKQKDSVSKHEVDEAFADFIALIAKYSGEPKTSVTILGDQSQEEKGYYALFVKRDETAPEAERVMVSAMGKHMPLQDLAAVFQGILEQILGQHDNVPTA